MKTKFTIFGIFTLALLSYGLYVALIVTPTEATMGPIQRIFYYHLPAAFLFFVYFFANFLASIWYLWKRDLRSDAIAVSTAEIGVVFCTVVLTTGPLWAKPVWGVWWVWDARLTSSLMLFLIFVAYNLLRKYGGPGSDKLGAGLALFGMANVPFIYVSVNYWRTFHPPTSVVPKLPVEMGIPLWYCVIAFTLLYVVLLRLRARLEFQRSRVEALYLAEDEL